MLGDGEHVSTVKGRRCSLLEMRLKDGISIDDGSEKLRHRETTLYKSNPSQLTSGRGRDQSEPYGWK